MFARTPRLLLRPGFPEDAPALALAIADEAIVRNLSAVPWPYRMRDAEAFLASPRDPVLPTLLIFERTSGAPQLVGACGMGRRQSGAVEMGYWIARDQWGRGIATGDLEKIFDEFERGTLATDDGGTGLGLTSVRSLVREQGGDVHIQSVVGQGTIVTVELPAPARGLATA